MNLTFLGVLSMAYAETWAQHEGLEGGVIAVLCSTYSGLSLSFTFLRFTARLYARVVHLRALCWNLATEPN